MLFFSLLSCLHCSLCWFSLICSSSLGIFFGMTSKIYLSFLMWNSLIIMSVYLTPHSAPSLRLFWKSLPPLLWTFFLSSVWPPQKSSKPHRCHPLWEARSWKFKTFDFLASFAASFQSGTLASWIRRVPRILSPGLDSLPLPLQLPTVTGKGLPFCAWQLLGN